MEKLQFMILFLLISSSIFAQVDVGIKVGANVSTLASSSHDLYIYEYKPGFHAGGVFHFQLSDRIALQSELLYANRGTNSKGHPSFDAFPTHFHGIHLPILIQLYPVKKLAVEFGPEIGYVFSITNNHLGIKEGELNAGVSAGLCYNISQAINIGVRYHYGVTALSNSIQVADHLGQLIDEQIILQNRVLQFSIAYLLTR